MRFIFSYMKKYLYRISFGVGLKFLGTILELLIPYVLEHLIDDVAPNQNLKLVLIWGTLMLLLAGTVRLFNVTANRNSVKVARNCAYEIRKDLFWHTMHLSGQQMDRFGLPSLISRMTSDSYNIQEFIRASLAVGIRAPIMLLGGIIITMTMDKGLASILLVLAPIMIILIVWISFKGIPLYNDVQKSVDTIVRIMRENISGIRVVKALSKEKYEMHRFDSANNIMAKKERRAGIVMSLPGPLMTLALNIGLTLVIIVGAIRVNNGVTKPGVILAFLTYFNMIMMGVLGLNRIFMMMSKANASANRIASVISEEEQLLALNEEELSHTNRNGYLIFDHVSFGYGIKQRDEQQLSLNNIDFEVSKGGSIGIIGATGSGKTTIIRLLMRFYDPCEGHIFINGKDVRGYSKEELHHMFGVAFQNDVIFADTLRENITFGRKLTNEELKNAVIDADAMEFIEKYENTVDHEVAIHGADLSGGQRQRILISRALAGNPEILILDDSSSALDYKTDAEIRRAIHKRQNITTIIIAQRISSIMNADQILVLDEGKIIGYGTHSVLLKECDVYREIYQTQMGEGR